MIDNSSGGTDIIDLSGNGKGVDINSDLADIDGATLVLADDAITFLDLGGGSGIPVSTFIFVNSPTLDANALVQVCVGSTRTINAVWRGNAAVFDLDTSAIAPTGTTGTDGHFLLRACGNGRMYLENRSGAAVIIKMFAMNLVG